MAKKLRLSELVLYEDDYLIAINKPANISSLHERFESQFQSIVELCKEIDENYSLCHRLDRETSGVMLISKNQEVYKHMAAQFENRSIQKIYHACISSSVNLPPILVDLPLYTDSKRRVQVSKKSGKPSLTEFKTLTRYKHFTLLSCKPLTGRLHQIRVHAASQNLPLVNDTLYGGKKALLAQIKKNVKAGEDEEKLLLNRIALHAYSIEFNHPQKGTMTLIAPYPKDFQVAIKLLEKYDALD